LISKKLFRKDLYYRIRGGWLHLPPLRERPEDIPLLVDRFLDEFCPPTLRCRIDEETLGLLGQYPYPGNIRELRSVIQSAVNLAQGGAITSSLLPAPFRENQKMPAAVPSNDESDAGLSLAEMEKTYLLKVYRQLNQNKSQTARRLGIGLNTLRRKLKDYGVA
jgi:transcriptional regulator with PAS, ATPase and Fis domain